MNRLASAVAVAVGVLAAGCYGPSAPAGVSCATTGSCPARQTCDPASLTCIPAAGLVDARSGDASGEPDAPDGLLHFSTVIALTSLDSPGDDTDPSLSGDALEIVFASDRDLAGDHDLFESSRPSVADPFAPPVKLATLSTVNNEVGTDLSDDGLALYYTRAPIGSSAIDVVKARRSTTTSTFSGVRLQDGLSVAGAPDYNPATCLNEQYLYVDRALDAANPADRAIFEYQRQGQGQDKWILVRELTELEAPGTEAGATFTRDCLTIVFTSDRTGVQRLYESQRPGLTQPFGAPVLLTELVDPQSSEADADFDATGHYLVFRRNGSLFLASTSAP